MEILVYLYSMDLCWGEWIGGLGFGGALLG